ncbi:MAG: hypothetical protein BAJALOKI3v1_310005 [Promethearchaeota archaeon]|jgi:hypothetical protein|nr:MAG: hypothetical protein BAJALOKI3v1_310005 [Candidatus Lokiarchaeota archaeon]
MLGKLTDLKNQPEDILPSRESTSDLPAALKNIERSPWGSETLLNTHLSDMLI